MNDEKSQGLRILKDTGCRVGDHLFIRTVLGSLRSDKPDFPDNTLCCCGAYTWEEYQQERGK